MGRNGKKNGINEKKIKYEYGENGEGDVDKGNELNGDVEGEVGKKKNEMK